MVDEVKSVKEGKAEVFFQSSSPDDVFYNPVQEFNRDVSIAIIRQYAERRKRVLLSSNSASLPPKGLKILEAFSASGLRSIRYAKEIVSLDETSEKLIDEIVANDISKRAVERIQFNIDKNRVGDIVKANHADACEVMYSHRSPETRFDVVDLDPYGSPHTFLDAAVQSVKDGGLLLVTCTDMAVLCGNASETCYTKYGAVSLKSKCCHEIGLRIVVQCIEANANKYGRYVEPLVAISADFYCRIAVIVHTSQKKCKETTSKLGHIYQCCGCETMTIRPLGQLIVDEKTNQKKYKLTTGPPVGPTCRFCNRPHHIGGPIWIAPIHDQDFVNDVLDNIQEENFGTFDRIKGVLSVISEELPDVPLYYQLDRLCSVMKVTVGKFVDFRSAILNAGFRVSISHCNKQAIKTDAPIEFLWTMMRAWERKNPLNRGKLSQDSVTFELVSKHFESKFLIEEVSFDHHPDANPPSRVAGLKRFQMNPLPNWGPMMRAKASKTTAATEKRAKNQGKYSKRKLSDSSGQDLPENKKSISQEQAVS